ncbi:uncharacterized protein BXZ73DRAFT_88757 [Epithele typhae]|uniref:uncharacterized protein n=1 Tax=Epithele typhae TaxID=378194 RepID=UPI002008298F|nr:uncharacterized protein BXZ73DRAFT_88757 [Epithele typhae]KAH9940540.1 hypothetical protein BXZ73DRAFT_88757 [Epithele typhae]
MIRQWTTPSGAAVLAGLAWLRFATAIAVPSTPPSGSVTVDPSLISISIEFFAFPGYTNISGTNNCLNNLADLRGATPAIRIGGTTQDRATYDPNLQSAVNYTVADPADAPASLTYGPSFFTLAGKLPVDDVTIGLNRQLNHESNSLAAGTLALSEMTNFFAVELGNEPDLYSSSSPIAANTGWSNSIDISNEGKWFTDMAPTLGNVFQGAVYLSWSTATLVSRIGSAALSTIKSISRHSYPQSACNGASTNLTQLMRHPGIVSYVNQFKTDANSSRSAGKHFFFGETNSATCGGGGISPTFGAALWIVDYALQSALIGVERLYFHHGTIGNCAYCWWGKQAVYSPYFGAIFVSDFLGADGATLAQLDDSTSDIAAYAVYSASGAPLRVLLSNSAYFAGTGARANATVALTTSGLPRTSARAKRMTAPDATARADLGAPVTIGGNGTFSADCVAQGTQQMEEVAVGDDGSLTVSLLASEAVIVYL